MTANQSKKIFLSHKGSDKNMVIDFKDTLKLLGYDPWLDDDAMPAGTPVDRAIMQGMNDSCAVVFFITASFEDRGYLQTEVDYAIREKYRKGDKFSIITLVFSDAGGNTARIPDLLEPFAWKTPSTHLEALREIVRALPIAPATVDWRSQVTGVAAVPTKQPPEIPDISEEAKTILCAAAKNNGSVMHIRAMGGESIEAGERSLVPDREPRTVARWRAGVKELQNRGYIEDQGHKGEFFQVTSAGYDAADMFAGY